MAEYKHQRAVDQQHLAYLAQTQRQSPAALAHNPWRAEAGLEAYLQHQRALVAVQDLERQRLQKLSQGSAESPHL